ncbi:VOC family protein [Nereida sp. MMG025]|uniref:VOC family protein n=1 Tax=Nereida sp. MMG025 TaxID=2909981 RepID=UPI001F381AA2|nr:VOC family protein [Nereida sp. MMG025]MCF6445446.1 VOC family protein [Nereida sp. MMG025]
MTQSNQQMLMWSELPVSNLENAVAFYNAVFDYGLEITMMGPQEVAIFPVSDGAASTNLYQSDAPNSGGATLHFRVADSVEAAMERVTQAGGTVIPMPIVDIPEGRFIKALDLDGNSIALFQAPA